ncbi:antizyme inhibitor 1-like isoform X1 [Myxocyprinus asiaticus]|uniref:antizyme inhibitor 1-like isoform X1 n=1 Tax=Myxocyprinus asiaticus TaxID=70543 RepID=UPI002223C12B|nr:antizyme inhibitor 1-like isoform X1 [Myxocyprinus asiaticus]
MKGFVDAPNYIIEVIEGGRTIEDVVDSHIYEQNLAEKNAFVVANLGALMRQHVLWKTTNPLIRPFYPVSCNGSPVVIEVLSALGVGFVCANKAETTLVLDHNVPPENIILSGVCKQLSLIKHAAKNGINYLVCENEVELRKIARAHPEAKLLLQVFTEAQVEEVSVTIGCSLKGCKHLLEMAKELSVDVVGVTFQVPVSCRDPQAYTHALSDARCIFDMGKELGFDMKILDIGGGFSGTEFQLKQIHSNVRPLLEAYFPSVSGVNVIAEPGNFYVYSSFTLAVNVIGKKAVYQDLHDELTLNDEPEFLYYMNDGVYGSFVGKLFGNIITAPSVPKMSLTLDKPVFPSSLWGPSCDALDQVVEHCLLPELSVGDWLIFSNIGASGQEGPATLSDTDQPPVYYTISTDDWFEMQEAGIALDDTMKNLSLVQYGL